MADAASLESRVTTAAVEHLSHQKTVDLVGVPEYDIVDMSGYEHLIWRGKTEDVELVVNTGTGSRHVIVSDRGEK